MKIEQLPPGSRFIPRTIVGGGHTGILVEWKYAFGLRFCEEHDPHRILSWCKEQFGQPYPATRNWHYAPGSYVFCFNREADAVAFKLRWC